MDAHYGMRFIVPLVVLQTSYLCFLRRVISPSSIKQVANYHYERLNILDLSLISSAKDSALVYENVCIFENFRQAKEEVLPSSRRKNNHETVSQVDFTPKGSAARGEISRFSLQLMV